MQVVMARDNRLMWYVVLVLALAVVPAWVQGSGAVPAGPVAEATSTRDASGKDVEAVAQAFADCWNRHDMEALSQLFADDAEFVNVVGLWWKGREEIKRAHEVIHSTIFKNSHLVVTKVAVRFLRPDIAIARSAWELTGHTGPGGELLPKRTGLLLFVLVRTGDGWRITDAQNTDIVEGVLAPPQPPLQ
jgi:uncharacterized protein (TIGR02246 family)